MPPTPERTIAVLSVSDLSKLPPTVLVASDGPAAMFVDLDSAHRMDSSDVSNAIERAELYPGVLVGLATRPLANGGVAVASALSFTLSKERPGEWGIQTEDPAAAASSVEGSLAASPHASLVLSQVLRCSAGLEANAGVWLESLAYSTLLASNEFRQWRLSHPIRGPVDDTPYIDLRRRGNVLEVRLARPERRNALTTSTRRAIAEALCMAIIDLDLRVELTGEGPSFCSGGDLDEFGTAQDVALAHAVRSAHGPAQVMTAAASQTTAFVHGPCVGAGVELAAFAGRVHAAAGTTFRLPEVGMGLIPGAGGTVSIGRRIGRWRTAWMAMTGTSVGTEQALEWGLVDDVD